MRGVWERVQRVFKFRIEFYARENLKIISLLLIYFNPNTSQLLIAICRNSELRNYVKNHQNQFGCSKILSTNSKPIQPVKLRKLLKSIFVLRGRTHKIYGEGEKCIAMYVENIKKAKIVIISACPHNCNKIRKQTFSLSCSEPRLHLDRPPFRIAVLLMISEIPQTCIVEARSAFHWKCLAAFLFSWRWRKSHIRE